MLDWQKISEDEGNFSGLIGSGSNFGYSIANLGDLDSDGFNDLAIGAVNDDTGGANRGACYILFMHANGTINYQTKIASGTGNFSGVLNNSDLFGTGIATIGDLDGDSVVDLAVGATNTDDGGTNRGAVWIIFLRTNGTVKTEQKISNTAGDFTGTLLDNNRFGQSVASLGDLDGDSIIDLAVGAHTTNSTRGAVWILFLRANGTVASHQLISNQNGGLGDVIGASDAAMFGASLALLEPGVIAVGLPQTDTGGFNHGAVWILTLNASGWVTSQVNISDIAGGFTGILNSNDQFGWSVCAAGDLNGDGNQDLVVGARFDDNNGTDKGAIWFLLLDAGHTVIAYQKVSETEGSFTATLANNDNFGWAIATFGDADGNGVQDFVVGAPGDDDGMGSNLGAAYVLFLQFF